MGYVNIYLPNEKKAMALNRKTINLIRYVLENILPPFIRDSKLFYLLMWLYYRNKTEYLVSFRKKAPTMSQEEYSEYYKKIPNIMTETDCNEVSIDFILRNIEGNKVIDIGCGRGYLANEIARHTKGDVSGLDFIIEKVIEEKYENIQFMEGAIEELPFDDDSYDTVVCTHTLEHILDIGKAISELRRITKKRLIIVVPSEREYLYSFNLHIHFFPYTHSFLRYMAPLPSNYNIEIKDGDICYREDID